MPDYNQVKLVLKDSAGIISNGNIGLNTIKTSKSYSISSDVEIIEEFQLGELKKSISTMLYVVSPIYLGATTQSVTNDNYTTLLKKHPEAKRTPGGNYTINNSTDKSYVYIAVPNTMTISKITLSGFDFPFKLVGGSPITGYNLYKSDNTYDKGNINIVIVK